MLILDWIMPGLSGLEICTRLRQDTSRPYAYVILLTAKNQTHDLIQGLDAGADTYLSKPIGPPELRVRLKTGERILAVETRLRYRIRNLQEEVQRLRSGTVPETGAVPGVEAMSAQIEAQEPLRNASRILEDVLAGLNVEPILPNGGPTGEPVFLARTAIILRRTEVWLCIGMALDRQFAEAVYRGMVGEPPRSDSDLLDALAEVLNMCQGALKFNLDEEGWQPMTPVLPSATLTAVAPVPVSETTSILVRGGIRFLFSKLPAQVEMKSADDLRPHDILADPICDPNNDQIVFLSRGIALNPRYIARIYDLVASGRVTETAFPVVIPLSAVSERRPACQS